MFNMNRNKSLLLVVDIQEKLSSIMPQDEFNVMINKTKILINGCDILGLPIIQSLQYVKGLGNSVDGLFKPEIKKIDFEKRVFSCCYEDSPLLKYLNDNRHISQIIISGMESHICVLQTVRDLLSLNYDVVIASDAVISRECSNKQNSLSLMQNLNAYVLNVESILFDLLKTSLAVEFKAISSLIK
ncbi:isochorismatase family protein [Helicobacter sp. MIT 14-3879]|uniref:isochorismatase family protein n=1 Tax=Helicobacter sp. MIT 14-3879 TaxID=2040649 RepID=UPI000E1E3394|nr:isochorismatase family protein [Helicobacter sp. MIT 14-3879]RDU65482.1 hydrolase [Helicobacter sp. MIT 14-3879]